MIINLLVIMKNVNITKIYEILDYSKAKRKGKIS